jgi:hypothetical protein
MGSSGMKRSLPCLELTSMDNIDSNPLLHIVNARMKYWKDDDAPLIENTAHSKKPRLLPMTPCPASFALESFLRMAVEDLVPLSELAQTDDCTSFRPLKPRLIALRNLDHHSVIPTLHDVTRGLARISASN